MMNTCDRGLKLTLKTHQTRRLGRRLHQRRGSFPEESAAGNSTADFPGV